MLSKSAKQRNCRAKGKVYEESTGRCRTSRRGLNLRKPSRKPSRKACKYGRDRVSGRCREKYGGNKGDESMSRRDYGRKVSRKASRKASHKRSKAEWHKHCMKKGKVFDKDTRRCRASRVGKHSASHKKLHDRLLKAKSRICNSRGMELNKKGNKCIMSKTGVSMDESMKVVGRPAHVPDLVGGVPVMGGKYLKGRRSEPSLDQKQPDGIELLLKWGNDTIVKDCQKRANWLGIYQRDAPKSDGKRVYYVTCKGGSCEYMILEQNDGFVFRNEVHAMIKLNESQRSQKHRLVPDIYAAWTCEGVGYIAMQRVDNCSTLSFNQVEELLEHMIYAGWAFVNFNPKNNVVCIKGKNPGDPDMPVLLNLGDTVSEDDKPDVLQYQFKRLVPKISCPNTDFKPDFEDFAALSFLALHRKMSTQGPPSIKTLNALKKMEEECKSKKK